MIALSTMRLALSGLIVTVLAAPGAVGTAWAADDAPVVKTKYGSLRGKRVGKADAFLGIPYAKPPVGELRWCPPQPPEPWTGVRPAVRYPVAAAQRIPNPVGIRQASEDCLYLNVFTPVARRPDKPLPVMMYIHGGSNVHGTPTRFTKGKEDLFVGQRSNIVFVTIQFRLGSLGFLAHPALTAESEHRSSGNYGMLDQVAALQWIHDNIAAFGGDPNRVTVFGGSSGSIDTGSLMASPLTKGIMHRAIMQSWPPAAPLLAEREKNQGLVFAERLGCADAEDVAAAMRAVPWQELTKLEVALGRTPAGAGFNPKVDGWALPDKPLDAFRRGTHNHIPFMIGAQAQDARAWAKTKKPIRNQQDYRAVLLRLLKKTVYRDEADKRVEELLKLYPLSRYKSPKDAYIDVLTERIHVAPDRATAVAVAASQKEPVYWYVFSHKLSGQWARYGADHPIINQFLFGLIRIGRLPPWYKNANRYKPTPDDIKVADLTVDYWTSFAADGHMDNASGPKWPRVDPKRPAVQIITVSPQPKVGYRQEQLDFWQGIADAWRVKSEARSKSKQRGH